VFFNKYLGGHPHLCRALDLSPTGMQVVVLSEPDGAMDSFPLELRLPGDQKTLWLWGRSVRRSDRKQAIEFVGLSEAARRRIARFVQAA
jgi:hypothetical protein